MIYRVLEFFMKCSLVWVRHAKVLNPLYWIVVGVLLYMLEWNVMFCFWVVWSLINYVLMLRRYDLDDASELPYWYEDEDESRK